MIVGLSLNWWLPVWVPSRPVREAAGRSLPLYRHGGKLRDVSRSDEKQPRAAVDGVVLAAGRSLRMGRSKPLLGVDDSTFITRVVKSLLEGGCREVVAVIGADDADAGAAASQAGARVVINAASESEQIDSLRLALRNLLPGAEGIVLLPVDHPLVSADTVATLIDAYTRARPAIARASTGGTAGHPTLFAETLFDELLHGDLEEGARTLIAAHDADVLDVPVDDRGVIADIDTPEDYRRHVGGEPA